MPRQSKIPVLRHHRPGGQAAVRIDGRDHYLGKHDSPESREKYDRLIALWLTRRRAPEPVVGAKAATLTIAAMILQFHEHAESYYRGHDGPTGELQNLCDALRPLRRLFGSTPASEFGPLALQSLRDDMIRSGLARTTVNARIHRVRRAFRWAASAQKIPGSVVADLDTVASLKKGRTAAPEPDPVEPVSVAVVEATLRFLSAPVAAMVRIQLLSGCRPGEVMIMRSDDIVMGESTWDYRPGYHKGTWRSKDRVIPLGPGAQAVIRPFLKADASTFLFDPREAVSTLQAARSAARKTKRTPSELAKRSQGLPGEARCEKYDRRTYRQAIARACDKAFPHATLSKISSKKLTPEDRKVLREWRRAHRWSPLRLRHTAATQIRARFGLEAAQVSLGHAKADVTQVYAERDLAKARAVMAEMG